MLEYLAKNFPKFSKYRFVVYIIYTWGGLLCKKERFENSIVSVRNRKSNILSKTFWVAKFDALYPKTIRERMVAFLAIIYKRPFLKKKKKGSSSAFSKRIEIVKVEKFFSFSLLCSFYFDDRLKSIDRRLYVFRFAILRAKLYIFFSSTAYGVIINREFSN